MPQPNVQVSPIDGSSSCQIILHKLRFTLLHLLYPKTWNHLPYQISSRERRRIPSCDPHHKSNAISIWSFDFSLSHFSETFLPHARSSFNIPTPIYLPFSTLPLIVYHTSSSSSSSSDRYVFFNNHHSNKLSTRSHKLPIKQLLLCLSISIHCGDVHIADHKLLLISTTSNPHHVLCDFE